MDKFLKGAKIAYYVTMITLGVTEFVVFSALYLACTRRLEKELEE